jgi:hypothetical protein
MKTSQYLRHHRRRKLFLEGLEMRAMLAGDVDVNVSDGNLIIRGDNDDNNITVTWISENTYEVAGVDTEINGDTEIFVATGVTRNIDVDLRSGNDTFTLTGSGLEEGVDLQGSVIVRLGDGDDVASIDGTSLRRVLKVDGGSGDDAVSIANSFAGDDLLVLTGSGIDGVTLGAVEAGDLLLVETGNGDDTIGISASLARHGWLASAPSWPRARAGCSGIRPRCRRAGATSTE